MVAWSTMVYLVSITIVMFVYTLLWDLYIQFWDLAQRVGADSQALGVLYAIHQYLPAAFFLSATFWYLVQAQRRDYTA